VQAIDKYGIKQRRKHRALRYSHVNIKFFRELIIDKNFTPYSPKHFPKHCQTPAATARGFKLVPQAIAPYAAIGLSPITERQKCVAFRFAPLANNFSEDENLVKRTTLTSEATLEV
jgi:hypothetical protein